MLGTQEHHSEQWYITTTHNIIIIITTTQCNDIFTGFTADNKVNAGRAGAIDVIVSAMRTHSNNAGVCEAGCGALKNITANGTLYTK